MQGYATYASLSMIWAEISAPTPNIGKPPSTVTSRLVFFTLWSKDACALGCFRRTVVIALARGLDPAFRTWR